MSLLPFKWFCALSTLCCFLSLTAPGFWHKQGNMSVGSWDCQASQFCFSPCCLLTAKSEIYLTGGCTESSGALKPGSESGGKNICRIWNMNGDVSSGGRAWVETVYRVGPWSLSIGFIPWSGLRDNIALLGTLSTTGSNAGTWCSLRAISEKKCGSSACLFSKVKGHKPC